MAQYKYNRDQLKAMAKLLYGTDNLEFLSTKQIAFIKAYLTDIDPEPLKTTHKADHQI
tara:strand:- start:101 stop:274 length:174 start_codon:yes stop_codon:yes gene_type:complete